MLRTHARSFSLIVLLVAVQLVAVAAPRQVPQDALALLNAAQSGNVSETRALIARGADVNYPTRYKTALMLAAGEGHAEVVDLLLANGAQLNTNTDEGTALMEAVKSGRVEIVKRLLAAGADVNAVHRTGDLTLLMAARQRSYRTPAAEPSAELLQLLLDHTADPNATDKWGVTALMSANTAAKVKLLVAGGANLEAKDKEGETALIKAASRGDVAVVGALLENGANVNTTDNAHGEERETLPKRRLEVARRLLLAKSTEVNAQNSDGETALMRAVRLGNSEMIQLLLAQKADANRSDVFGDTAVTLAYAGGNAEIEKLLPAKTYKGQPRAVLNAFLRAAVRRSDEAKVRELLAKGADPNHEYAIGYTHKTIKRTVLVDAASMGQAGIVQLLLDKGADPNAKGLISGSEHGLTYGTALEAAELSKKPEVVALLRKAQHD
jgi:ankyrin repeat protein